MGFKVGKKFRTNKLSHIKGGVTIFVQDTMGRVLEYDDVKNPFSYIKTIKKSKPNSRTWWIGGRPKKYII